MGITKKTIVDGLQDENKTTTSGHTVYKNKAGKRVPSTTGVISNNCGWSSRMLMDWMKREFRAGRDPDDTSGEACKIGSLVHGMIEHHIFGQDEYEPEDGVTYSDICLAGAALSNYIKWEEENNVVYLESELAMVSESLQTGGCCDSIALVNGKVTLIDFKTSKRLYDSHIIQTACYRDMVHELTDYVIEDVMVIRIDKTVEAGSYVGVEAHIIPPELVELGSSTFKTLRQLHDTEKMFAKYLRSLK